MSDPKTLITEYRNRIAALAKEIASHPFKYMVGFRWKDESNFKYRREREEEIARLNKKIKEEEDRYQLLSHYKLNKELEKQGIQKIEEKTTPLDNFLKFNKQVNPFQVVTDRIFGPIAGGLSSPLVLIVIGIGAVIVLVMVFRK